MKRFHLYFIGCFLFINNLLIAQSITINEAKIYADKLVARQILTKKGEETFLQQLANRKIEVDHPSTVKQITYAEYEPSKELIISFCLNAFWTAQARRIFGKNNPELKIVPEDTVVLQKIFSSSDYMGASMKEDYVHPKRSTMGFTRTRTLKDFKEIGLINDTVFNECLQKLNDSTIRDEVSLLRYMTERSVYYRYYDFNKNEQKEYIESLASCGLLTRQSQAKLWSSYGNFELKAIPEILSYSDRYVLVNLENTEPDPQVTYPIIFENIKKLIKGFDYRDLTVNVKETIEKWGRKDSSDDALVRQDVELGFTANGNLYRNVFFHNYRRVKPDTLLKKMPLPHVDEDFHKGVNKWLTDIESPYRLYTVGIWEGDETKSWLEPKSVGLLLLKDKEAAIVSENVNLLSRESFDNRLSRKNIDKLLNEFSEQGFFSHLAKEQIDSARKSIFSSDITSIEDILLHFPDMIVVFDWETGNLENPYEELTKKFALASRGAVQVSNLTDEYKRGWDKAKKIKYGFDMNGKHYEAMLPFEGDWLAPEFMRMFSRALKENEIDGKLYYCVDNGQESGYIFLTSKQYLFVKSNYPDLLKEN